ncbi:hypothetical protein [Thioclava sp. F36-7]|uniref:hypothetical protein n=1 Tax=Thioclava sp. F36-7 TaxID=1915317 RepID=UPI00099721AB|nr:hypothetical protein [Thioclava sp. F36-7]OOY07361.1 hypothetical protein BMI89_17975 [Thioclava sp. F36-7]
MKATTPKDRIATASEIAKAAGRTVRWVQLQAKEGRFKRSGRDRYDLLSVVAGMAALADEREAQASRSDARNRIDEVRAAEAELRLAERRRELIPQSEALEDMSLLVGKVAEEFNGMARRCTRDVVMQTLIEKEADASRRRLSDFFADLAGGVQEGAK